MPTLYPDSVREIAKVVIDEIEKHFPGMSKKKIDNFGFQDPQNGGPALERAEFCIYIELMKAGAFNNKFVE